MHYRLRLHMVAIALSSAISQVSVASTPSPAILVVSPDAWRQQWINYIADTLTLNLRYPLAIGQSAAEGLATVTFRSGEDGRPTDVALTKSSGDRQLDRAAIRAVERLHSLRPLPTDISDDQLFLANIVFATDSKRTKYLLAESSRTDAPLFAANALKMRVAVLR